jgi:phosphoribosyl 1,2-cyclic phosphodiesterase
VLQAGKSRAGPDKRRARPESPSVVTPNLALDSHGDRPVRIWLLGVRGSTPAPGTEFVRYGGHTACVAVAPDGADVPTLALDAGTGLRSLTAMLPGPAFRGAILLSHLHWDHVQGIPFFVAGDHYQSAVDLYLPAQGGMSGRDLLARMMSPPCFPITPEGLRGSWTFNALRPGRADIAGFGVTAAEIAHKGGRTYGYRVDTPSASLAYLPDHGPVQGCSDEVRAMIRGVDVLLHDAQFVEAERSVADLFGHATIDDAIQLATEASVGTLVLFHHGPARTDDQLDRIGEELQAPISLVLAREGQVIEVGPSVAITP